MAIYTYECRNDKCSVASQRFEVHCSIHKKRELVVHCDKCKQECTQIITPVGLKDRIKWSATGVSDKYVRDAGS